MAPTIVKHHRPTALSRELAIQIAQNMEQGLTFADACELEGIGMITAQTWKEKGESEIKWMVENGSEVPRPEFEPFAIFADAVRKAIPRRKKNLLESLQRKGARSWLADAWMLERLHPEEFGRIDRIKTEDLTKAAAATINVYLPQNGRETQAPSDSNPN